MYETEFRKLAVIFSILINISLANARHDARRLKRNQGYDLHEWEDAPYDFNCD